MVNFQFQLHWKLGFRVRVKKVIACGKVLKTNICIAFPHEIACGEVIKTNIFITFPHEIAWGKVIKIFVLPGVYKRGCS